MEKLSVVIITFNEELNIKRCLESVLTVADEGPGIPDFALDRVFERFYTLSNPEGGSSSSGLGLSFVNEVSQLHGGKIELENRLQGGAIARFTLPLKSELSTI